jgi:hypothetical protein
MARCTSDSAGEGYTPSRSCHVLDIPDSDQRLVVYSPAPGSASAVAFRRLADGINARAAGFTQYG